MSKIIKVSLIIIGAVATGILSLSMLLIRIGAKKICFYEPNIFISSLELALGFISSSYLFYLAYKELNSPKNNKT